MWADYRSSCQVRQRNIVTRSASLTIPGCSLFVSMNNSSEKKHRWCVAATSSTVVRKRPDHDRRRDRRHLRCHERRRRRRYDRRHQLGGDQPERLQCGPRPILRVWEGNGEEPGRAAAAERFDLAALTAITSSNVRICRRRRHRYRWSRQVRRRDLRGGAGDQRDRRRRQQHTLGRRQRPDAASCRSLSRT